MDINLDKNAGKLIVSLTGRLDTVTAPELEKTINENITDVNDLVFDFDKLDYISSAGLRVILSCQKIMQKQGTMKIINVCNEINEVFELTAFNNILTIEKK